MLRTVISTYAQAFSGLPRQIWWLSLVLLVNRAGTMVLPFLVIYLTQARGVAPKDAGFALFCYGIGACCGAWFGGWLTDRLGARKVMLGSLLASGLGFYALGQMTSWSAIIVVLLVLSLFNEAFRPANGAAIAASCRKDQQKQAFALLRLAVNAGMSIGPAAGGFLAEHDFSLVFLVDGVTCWSAAVLLIVVVPATVGAPPEMHASGAPGASPWRDGQFLLFLALMTVSAAMFFQLFGAYPLHFDEVYGLKKSAIGLLLSINTVIIVAVEMVLVHKLRHFNDLRLVGLGSALVGIGFAMLPFGSGALWAALSVVVWTTGEMLVGPMGGGYVGHRAPASSRGSYMALFTMAWAVGHMLGPWLGAIVYQYQGPDALWISTGILGVLLWIGFSALARRQ